MSKVNKFAAWLLICVLFVAGASLVLATDVQLPVDTSVRYKASELVIEGNVRIPTAELLKGAPSIYNISG